MKDIYINAKATVKETLKKLDISSEKALLVINKNNNLIGTITDGDIRRFIINGNNNFDQSIEEIYNKNPIYIYKNTFSLGEIKKIMLSSKITLVPVLNEDNTVFKFYTWDQVFSTEENNKRGKNNKINIPVIIMAGGKGTRLEPFTKVLPKPLVPIGDKTIIEIIIENFSINSVRDFYIILNYKGNLIRAYMDDIKHDLNLNYVFESKFQGTAGSIKLLESEYIIKDNFILSNCDVVVKVDFSDVIKFHSDNNAILTILSSIQHYKIPYGILEYKNKGELIKIKEKPEFTFNINTGIYIVNREIFKFIENNEYLDMNDLIQRLLDKNKKVLIYPVNTSDYIDIGQWEEYKKNSTILSM